MKVTTMKITFFNSIFLIVAGVGMLLNILAFYSSLRILKMNQKVYSNKLNDKLYQFSFNTRFHLIIIVFNLAVFLYSSYIFDLDTLSKTSQKLVWLNSTFLVYMFLFFVVLNIFTMPKLWLNKMKNHKKIMFREFGYVVTLFLTLSIHFVIYIIEFKIL